MRIAYLTSCSPLPPTSGHGLRVNANWRALSELGEVRVFAFDSRPPPAARTALRGRGIVPLPARRERPAARLGRHARSFMTDRSMLYAKAYGDNRLGRLKAMLEAWPCDLLVVGDTWLADLVPFLRRSAHRVVVDTHNVESRLYGRIVAAQPWPGKLKYLLFARNARRLERHLAEVDAVWAVSAADAGIYRDEFGVERVAVLPNAIDTTAYAPGTLPPEPHTIVFTGSFGYWPNHAAAMHLIGLSQRLAAAGHAHRMLLVGREANPAMLAAARAAPMVTVTGPVPDIRPFIARAGIVAAPLSVGSGTKYKVLEALALGRPVVTTPIGAEGLGLRDGASAIIAPDLAAFDASVAACLCSPAALEDLGAAGRRWVAQTHSLEALGRALREALAGIGLGAAMNAAVEQVG